MTHFLRALEAWVAPGTYDRYERALNHFLRFQSTTPVTPLEILEPRICRQLVHEYLVKNCYCRLSPYGFGTEDFHFRVHRTEHTRNDFVGLLVVLKRYYDWLEYVGFDVPNPFVTKSGRKHGQEKNALERPQDRKWLFGEAPRTYRRAAENYFRIPEDEWTPRIQAPLDAAERLLTSGIALGWPARAEALARVIIDSAARINEACCLTIGDWWAGSRFLNRAKSKDKGSAGRRRKELSWSGVTTRVIRNFVDGERRGIHPNLLTLSEYARILADSPTDEVSQEPIFVTRRLSAVDPGYFRRTYWTPAAQHAGINFTPHQARHRLVSMYLDRVDELSLTTAEKGLRKKALVNFMGWRSKERMLAVYDARQGSNAFKAIVMDIHATIDEETQLGRKSLENTKPFDDPRKEKHDWLTNEGDEDD